MHVWYLFISINISIFWYLPSYLIVSINLYILFVSFSLCSPFSILIIVFMMTIITVFIEYIFASWIYQWNGLFIHFIHPFFIFYFLKKITNKIFKHFIFCNRFFYLINLSNLTIDNFHNQIIIITCFSILKHNICVIEKIIFEVFIFVHLFYNVIQWFINISR